MSHNAVERRRQDNINGEIYLNAFWIPMVCSASFPNMLFSFCSSCCSHRFSLTHGNASKDSLLARSFGMSQGNASRNSLVGHSPSPFARSASPAFYSPFGGSPSLGRASNSRSGSPFIRGDSPLNRGLPRTDSSNDLHSPTASPDGGKSPRITRENAQKILEKRRSFDSPPQDRVDSPPIGPSPSDTGQRFDTATNSPASITERRSKCPTPSRVPPPKLTRDNPTYDGVMTNDPEPQPSDPPMPDMIPRAASLNAVPDAPEARVASDRKGVIGLKIEAVTEGIKPGRHSLPGTVDIDTPLAEFSREDAMNVDAMEDTESLKIDAPMRIDIPPMGLQSLLSTSFTSPPAMAEPARPISPRPPIVKDAIKTHEELIKVKKREARLREEAMKDGPDTSTEYFTPRRPLSVRRRSLSTGDAEAVLEHRVATARRRTNTVSDGGLLEVVSIEDDEDDPLADSIDRELRKLKGPSQTVSDRSHFYAIHVYIMC